MFNCTKHLIIHLKSNIWLNISSINQKKQKLNKSLIYIRL